jgi:CBS domain-containing protein
MMVSDILSRKGRDVVTIAPAASVADAVALLAQHRIGAVVVQDEADGIAGIISERDIVHAMAKDAKALAKAVSSIMTRSVVTCSERDTVDAVMAQMTHGRFRHLPVVAGGRMTGIVSIGDVVKERISEVEREAAHMRAYIATA